MNQTEHDWLTEPRTRLLIVAMVCLLIAFGVWTVNQSSNDAGESRASAAKAEQALAKANQAVDQLRGFLQDQCHERQRGVATGNARAQVIREFLTIAEQARRSAAANDTDAVQATIDQHAAERYATLRARVLDSPRPDCSSLTGDSGGP